MRLALAIGVLLAAAWLLVRGDRRATHATWDGERFACPAGTDMWADENEALAGKEEYVYCIER